jgi:uncharacterized membrane protein YdbT with pleckstrin-like domain
MSYLSELLGEGETVVFASRQHWFILFARILLELILVVLAIAAAVVSYRAWEPPGQYIAIAAAAIAVLVLVSALRDYLKWNSEQFIVTDRRVLQLEGVLNKTVVDSSLEKINDVELQQTMFGRMFDYGTIEILTASEEAINRMDNIAHPLQFKRAMQDARARYDGYLDRSQVRPYEQNPRGDIQSVLEQLASLHARGILSDTEFETKKRELLSRI